MIQAKRALPRAAFRELFRGDDVVCWAQRHHVDAPSMIEHARFLVAEAANLDPAERAEQIDGADGPTFHETVDQFKGALPAGADEWFPVLAQLDALRLDPFREDVLDRVADDNDPHVGAPSLLPALRRAVLHNPAVRAPLSADPLTETADHFLRRAQNHYDARAHILARLGLRRDDARPTPSLLQHVEWLIRFQIGRETHAEIARTEGAVCHRTAVIKAIREVARLIRLPLRRRARGRPHQKRPR